MAHLDTQSLPPSRQEALRVGAKRYTSQKPCKYGHQPVRFTSSHACVECSRRKTKAYYHDNGGNVASKLRHMRVKYGLDAASYYALLGKQGRKCAICQTPLEAAEIHVDHNHETGAVRGLLCVSCNRGIGLFRDDPERLARAISYLKDPPHGE